MESPIEDEIPQEARGRRGPRGTEMDLRAAAWLVAAGAAAAWAAVFAMLGLAAAPHLNCRHDCGPQPRGVGWTLGLCVLWLTVMSICGQLAMVPRQDPKTNYRRAAVAGFVVATLPAVVAVHWLRTGQFALSLAGPPALHQVWVAPPDRPSNMHGLGVWSDGSTVVRVRTDEAVAFDAASGEVEWTYRLPGEAALCSMSRGVSGDVGLIGYALDGQPCSTVVAVDLTSGKQLWQATRTAAARSGTGVYHDDMAVGGSVAVLRQPTSIVGLDAHTGKQLWQEPISERGCAVDEVAADPADTLVALDCGASGGRVLSLATPKGARQWESAPPFADAIQPNAEILSVEPAVVHFTEQGSRGENVVVSYDGSGARRAVIPVLGSDEDIDLGAGDDPDGFSGTPIPLTLIMGDDLITAAGSDDNGLPSWVSAYSLADGHRLWQASLSADDSGMVVAVVRDGAGVDVALDEADAPQVLRLDAATGSTISTFTATNTFPAFDTLLNLDGRFVFVNHDGSEAAPVFGASD